MPTSNRKTPLGYPFHACETNTNRFNDEKDEKGRSSRKGEWSVSLPIWVCLMCIIHSMRECGCVPLRCVALRCHHLPSVLQRSNRKDWIWPQCWGYFGTLDIYFSVLFHYLGSIWVSKSANDKKAGSIWFQNWPHFQTLDINCHILIHYLGSLLMPNLLRIKHNSTNQNVLIWTQYGIILIRS